MRHSSRPSNSRTQLSRHRRIASPRPPLGLRRNAAMDSSHLRSRPSATPACVPHAAPQQHPPLSPNPDPLTPRLPKHVRCPVRGLGDAYNQQRVYRRGACHSHTAAQALKGSCSYGSMTLRGGQNTSVGCSDVLGALLTLPIMHQPRLHQPWLLDTCTSCGLSEPCQWQHRQCGVGTLRRHSTSAGRSGQAGGRRTAISRLAPSSIASTATASRAAALARTRKLTASAPARAHRSFVACSAKACRALCKLVYIWRALCALGHQDLSESISILVWDIA